MTMSVSWTVALACLGGWLFVGPGLADTYDHRQRHQLQRQQRAQHYDLKTRQQQNQFRSSDTQRYEQQHSAQRRAQAQRQIRQQQRSLLKRPETIQRQKNQLFEREYRQQDLGFKIQDRQTESILNKQQRAVREQSPPIDNRFNR